MSLVIDLIDLVAKHKSGELRCPATALILARRNAVKLNFYTIYLKNATIAASAILKSNVLTSSRRVRLATKLRDVLYNQC